MRALLRRLRARIRYRRFDDDLQEELAFHRDMHAAAGQPEVARTMGNELRARELARDVWVPASVDSARQDLKLAVRMLSRRGGLAVGSIAALVVGIGAATLAFVLLNTLVLRPLPVARPDRLVYLDEPSFSFPLITEVRARATFLQDGFGWTLDPYDVQWGRMPEPSLVLLASGNIYDVLGIRPAVGRLLTPTDEGNTTAEAQAVGVLSHGAWQRRFGGEAAIVGRIVRVQGVPVTIVGVTPPGFFGVAPGRSPEITLPVTLAGRLRRDAEDPLTQPAASWLHFMGRLRDDVSLPAAQAMFQTLWPQALEATVSRDAPPDRRARLLGRQSALMSGATGFSAVRNRFRQPLLVLAGLATLLLVVGCATVANMLIAGAWGRSRELAVRLAIGCSRGRLARQLIVEGLVLAGIAAVIALAASQAAGDALIGLLTTTNDPVALDLTVDWRVSLFLALTVVTATLVFSAAPVLLATRVDPGPSLKCGSPQVAGQGRALGRVLVGVQVALSVVLLVGAALLGRSLVHLVTLDPGIDGRRLLLVRIDPAWDATLRADADAAGVDRFYRAALDALSRTRGVDAVSLSYFPPLSDDDGAWTQRVRVDGDPVSSEGARTFFNAVAPDYFTTVGMRIVAGRDFTWNDTAGGDAVVIVNQSFAARVFPGESPLGRRLTIGRDAARATLTVVGVVSDARYQRLQETQRDIAYVPVAQSPMYASGAPLVASVRVFAVTEAAAIEIADAVTAAFPLATPRVIHLADSVRDALVTERLLATLAVALAACALFLACASLFGLMAHLVARRTRELGIRIALGARTPQILRPIVGQALLLIAIGVVMGSALAFAGGRWIAGLLHGITPADPIAYLLAAGLTLLVGGAAGAVPARRAATTDPLAALRAE